MSVKKWLFFSRKFFAYVFMAGGLFAFTLFVSVPAEAVAGINEQMNFQGRLLNAQGATVADGVYNIQFKLYQDGDGQSVGNTTGSPAGTLLWTESHLNANTQGVTVKNGFLSVQLGSITPFAGAVDWNQDTLWLSMNIGSTASCSPFSSCSPDGEMIPMKRLSATPYALNSARFGGLTSNQFVQLGQGLQGDATNNSSIFINKTGTGNLIEFQDSGATAFSLTNTGDIQFGANANHTISVAATGAGVAGRTLTVTGGAAGTGSAVNGGDLMLQGGAPSGTGTSSVIVRSNTTNSTGAFQVQKADNTPVLRVDTTNSIVQVAGAIDTTSSGTLTLGGTNASAISLTENTTVSGANTLTVGTGLTSLGGGLAVTAGPADITNSLALKQGTDFSTTGTTNNANFGEASLIRLTGGSTQIITGVANGRDGEILTIINAAGQEASITNNDGGSLAQNRIITGTGSNVALPAGASLTMVYDAGSSLWRITSGVASTGGTGVNAVGAINGQTKHANGAVIVGTTIYLQTADATNVGLVSTGTQTLAGAKSFSSLLTGSAGATFSGGALSMTGNAASSLTTSSGALTLTSAAAATWSTGSGDLTLQAGSGTVSLGTSTGLTSTNALTVTGGSTLTLRSTGANGVTIDTGGAAGVNIGAVNANAVSISRTGQTTTINGALAVAEVSDFTQSTAFKRGTDFSTTGSSDDVSFANASLIRLTGASAQTITGIANGRDGYVLTLVNAASQAATIANNSGSSLAANRIITGTGASLTVPAGASLTLVYDSGSSLWRVSSGAVAATGGYIQNQSSAQQPSSTFWISGTGQADGGFRAPSIDVASPGTLSVGTSTANAITIGKTGITTTNAGALTATELFTGNAGATINGGAIGLTANAASSFTTSSGALTLTSAAAATWSTAGGDLTLQAGSGTVKLGTSTALNSNGALTITAGGALGLLSTGATTSSLDTGGAAAVNIGTVNANAVSISRTGQTTTVNGALAVTQASDFTQSVAMKRGTDFSTTGTTDDANFANASLIRLTGASAQTITGIANGRDGYFLTIVNAAGQAAIISNNAGGSLATNRIITGTGSNVTLPAGASITLVYDAGASLWRVSSGAVAATGGYIQNQNSAQQASSNFWISGTGQADGGFIGPSLDVASAGLLTIGGTLATTIQVGNTALSTGTQAINIGTNNTSGGTTNVTIGAGASATGGTTAIQSKGNTTFTTNGVVRGTFDTSNNLYLGNGTTAAAPNDFTVSATGSATAGVTGAKMTIQGGAGASATTGGIGGGVTIAGGNAGGSGNNAGGTITLQGGNKTNTGAAGTVLVKNSADSTNAFQVQRAADSAVVLGVDTTNTRVGIGTATPGRTLDIAINDSTVNGLPVRIAQSGTGDSGLEFSEPAQSYFVGIDASDHKFKISSSTVGTTITNMGYNAIGALIDSDNSDTLNATKFTAGATGTINTVYAYIGPVAASPNNKSQAAIYTDSSGTPGSRLGASTGDTTITANAWNAIGISSTSVTNGTVYWIVYNTSSAAGSAENNLRYDTNGTANQVRWTTSGATYGTWPTNWPGGGSSNPWQFSIYAPIITGTNGDNLANGLFQMTATGESLFQNSLNSSVAFRIQNATGTNMVALDTSASTLNLGASGTDAVASTVNIGTSTGATQSVRLGATTAGAAAAGTTVSIQGGTTANSAVVIGTNAGGGITMDTGTTGTINIGTSTTNNAKTINIGPTATKTSATTIQLGVNTAGTSTVHIGSTTNGTAATGTTINIQGGTNASSAVVIGTNGNGGISIDSGTTGAVSIGTGANAKTVTVGSTSGTTQLQAGAGTMTINVGGTIRGTFANSNNLYLGNGVTAAAPNAFNISGTGSATTAVAGGGLTVQGGNATVGNANGGNLTLTGGSGFGTGVKGLVVIDTPTFTTSTTQNCSSNCNVTQANIDSSAAVLINATNPTLTVTLTDPTILTAGKIMYVTNIGTTNDFTLSVNGGGTGNVIAMKPNTTATMVWNGADWTAAGASSSTDLQSAYNNTLTSAGGAELVLNAPGGSADGLTIRNNATTPIIGAILEAQTSVGSNLFSVNNNATEYANNGGAEGTTFTMWTGAPAGGTITRYTTAGNNIATGVASVFVDTTSTAATGVRNTLSSTLTPNLKYRVSYTIRHTSSTAGFTTLDTVFSRDGTNTGTVDCATAQTATFGQWSRISCTFTAPSSGITSSNAVFIRHSDAVEHDFYIDNLSVNVSADVSHGADGSVDLALGTNWTAYDADGGAGTTTLSRDTSVIFDTSGAVKDDTTNNANLGMRNNMSITPQISTQYLVSFYARSSNTFNNITVGFLPAGGNATPNAAQLCTDYNTQNVSTTGWTKITCLFSTPASGITDPDLVIYQPTAPGSTRSFYVDALSITLNTNNASNVQVGSGNKGGPATLFTLDRSNGAPIANNNDAYLGSMFYDTASGRIQCYEADGWGACGAAPDNIVNLNPEYAGAVLNGTGVGTMTADFCSNDTALTINSTLCSTGQAKNFYRWTSPQGTQQTYSIYVTYQLPATFNGFSSDDTVQLTARVDNTTNASVTYEMFKSTGSAVTQCGTGETNVITGGGGSANTWYSYGINGNEATGCSFSSSSAGNLVIFKINLKANTNANAYVSTLTFTTTGR
jgi:hypothetical protein